MGCSTSPGTGSKGYVTGNGQVTVVPAADRGAPISLSGQDLDGRPVDVAAYRGKPVVVLVWGSWCVPCRAEAPMVVKAAADLGDQAQFLGIDIRDNVDAAKSFGRTFHTTWPSLNSPDGRAMLAFQGRLSPRSIPSFAVLDAEGRIGGLILGELPSAQTLVTLVQEVRGG